MTMFTFCVRQNDKLKLKVCMVSCTTARARDRKRKCNEVTDVKAAARILERLN